MAKVTSAERRMNLTDATPARNQRLTNVVLWGIAVVYVVGTMFTRILSVPVSLVPLLFPFALIHGAKRYAWNGIVVFVVFTFIISNILQNLSHLGNIHDDFRVDFGPCDTPQRPASAEERVGFGKSARLERLKERRMDARLARFNVR